MNVQKKWIITAKITVQASVWCYAETEEEAARFLRDLKRSGNIVQYNTIETQGIEVITKPRPWGCHECGADEGDMHKSDCPKIIRLRAQAEEESQS